MMDPCFTHEGCATAVMSNPNSKDNSPTHPIAHARAFDQQATRMVLQKQHGASQKKAPNPAQNSSMDGVMG